MSDPETTIRYYNWEGDACRVYRHKNGDLTADIFYSADDIREVAASDVIDGARQIGEEEYKKMTMDKMALRRQKRQG